MAEMTTPATEDKHMHDDTTTVTHWHCERCQRSGQVTHDARADVWSVYQRLINNHRKVSPTCDGGRWQIRVSLTPVADWSKP